MLTRYEVDPWIIEALRALNGSAPIPRICEWIWANHESDLRNAGDLFYTWQYDVRWAATRLRGARKLKPAGSSPKGVWELMPSEAGSSG